MDDCKNGIWNHRILNNGTCKACPDGLFGSNCSASCPHGQYGLECIRKCYCTKGQYCHPVNGCGTLLVNGTFILNGTGDHIQIKKNKQPANNICKTERATVCPPCESNAPHSYSTIALSGFLSGFITLMILLAYILISKRRSVQKRQVKTEEQHVRLRRWSRIEPNDPQELNSIECRENRYSEIRSSNIMPNNQRHGGNSDGGYLEPAKTLHLKSKYLSMQKVTSARRLDHFTNNNPPENCPVPHCSTYTYEDMMTVKENAELINDNE